MAIHNITKPYLLLIGDMENPNNAKTALGLRDWTPEACIAQHRFGPRSVDIGLPEMTPTEAAGAGVKTAVIGITPSGGRISDAWLPSLLEALDAGLDIAAGLHQRLSSIPAVAERAAKLNRTLHDVRHSDLSFSVGNGKRRSGRRLLTVGTDCALGKKYTALAITKAMLARGLNVDFRATGQTGILISGHGVAVDAVVADFISGAAEALSPDNTPDHWDIIEGQGTLFHPAYAGVTLGLVHGSQPDALVLCHDPTRTHLNGFGHIPIRPLDEVMAGFLAAARLTNPAARFVGVALNTSRMNGTHAESVIRRTADLLGLPCVDPIRMGVDPIVVALETFDAG